MAPAERLRLWQKRIRSLAERTLSRLYRPLRRVLRVLTRKRLGLGRVLKVTAQRQPVAAKRLRLWQKRTRSLAERTFSRLYRSVRRVLRVMSAFFRKTLGFGRVLKNLGHGQRVAAKRVKGLRKRWWRFRDWRYRERLRLVNIARRQRARVAATVRRQYRKAGKALSWLVYKKLRFGAAVKWANQLDRRAAKTRKVIRKRWWRFLEWRDRVIAKTRKVIRKRWWRFLEWRHRVIRQMVRRFWKLFAWFFLRVLGLRPVVKFTRRVRKRYASARRWPGSSLFRRASKIWVRDPIARWRNHIEYHYRSDVRGIHLKEFGRTYEHSYKGPWGKLRYQRTVATANRKKRAMFKSYTRVSSIVSLDVPFVYVPLHFQPERTTSSLGGVFADQYLLVDLIARSMPEGWKVYVKEHPSQFYPPFAGERSRHQDLYRDLAQIPRVHLVSLSVSTFELIDRSRAVATVTGTAGWEAVLRGRPALVVGNPWYRYCDGVFSVSTESSLRAALTQIEDGYTPDPRKVRLFVKVLTERCVRASLGYNTPDELELGFTLTENVDRVVTVLERYWDRMRVEPAPSLFLVAAPPLQAATRAPFSLFNRGDVIGGLHPVQLLPGGAPTPPAGAPAQPHS
ncbi:MAG TPA: hypothetical protein VNJ02_04915 [Vicinamibacterales bacterium]|nr:hypothetical protein [Vicinamibacterales bacterium]